MIPTAATGTHHAVITIKDYGDIKLVLDGDTAPITVKNFVELAKSGFYDGLTFHRIIQRLYDSGRRPRRAHGTGGSKGKQSRGEFAKNGVESNDFKHTSEALSPWHARRMPDSATSQFFIMHKDGCLS